MHQLLRDLRAWYQALLARLAGALAASPGTLQLTGVLGLAALLYGLYALRGGRAQRPEEERRRRCGDNSGECAPGSSAKSNQQGPAGAAAPQAARPEAAGQAGVQRVEQRSLAAAVGSLLGGVRTVTMSAPGVLLHQWTPAELQEAAVARPDAVAVAREIVRAGAALYVLAQVADDLGEATVRGALEAGGLVGGGPGQIPAHRVLFCSTLVGKTSIVRQLEPDLHVDGHPHTIEGLARFMPQLLHIRQQGMAAAAAGFPNVGSAGSLIEVFQTS